MVRASKTSEKQTAPVQVVAEVPAQVAASKPRAKKVAAPKEEKPVAPAPVVGEQVVAAPVDDMSSLTGKMNEFGGKLQQLIGLLSTAKVEFKLLEKVVAREMKVAQKAASKKKRSNVNRKPSGFIKPTRISDELAEFLGKTVGTEMARTEVSKEINAYIVSKGLQDKANGRKINPDDKLTKLLKLSKEDELTYFNLQRFMKHHFIKAVVAAV
jgi:upstream activation factor subunit UAF30